MPYVNPFQGNPGLDQFLQHYGRMVGDTARYGTELTDMNSESGMGKGTSMLTNFLSNGFYGRDRGGFERWLSDMTGRLYTDYVRQSSEGSSPDQLTWMQYLADRAPDLMNDWSITSKAERGQRPEQFLSARTRWIR